MGRSGCRPVVAPAREPSTPAEPPGWLDLDALCPPDIRVRAAAIADQLDELTATLVEVVEEASEVLEHLDSRLPDGPGIESPYVLFGRFTGHTRLAESLYTIVDVVEGAL